MLNVTDRALVALEETLRQNETASSDVLRFAVGDEGLALSIGEERDGDQVIEHEGRTVLAIEPDLADALDGASIDAVETPEGLRLVFEAPRA